MPAAAACAVSVLALSANVDGRFMPAHRRYLALFNPAARDALPDPGGILYSDDMTIFFQGIYRLPKAPWRYMVGFEPALMPPDDLALDRAMTDRRNRVPEMYEVWVRRMRPEDRMILETTGLRDPPPVAGLEWRFFPPTYWSGRIPARVVRRPDRPAAAAGRGSGRPPRRPGPPPRRPRGRRRASRACRPARSRDVPPLPSPRGRPC